MGQLDHDNWLSATIGEGGLIHIARLATLQKSDGNFSGALEASAEAKVPELVFRPQSHIRYEVLVWRLMSLTCRYTSNHITS